MTKHDLNYIQHLLGEISKYPHIEEFVSEQSEETKEWIRDKKTTLGEVSNYLAFYVKYTYWLDEKYPEELLKVIDQKLSDTKH